MSLSQRRTFCLASASLLLICLAAPGGGLHSDRAQLLAVADGAEGQNQAQAGSNEKLRELLLERYDILKGIVESHKKWMELGRADASGLMDATVAMFHAEADLYLTDAERIKVYEKLVAALREHEAWAERKAAAGRPEMDAWRVKVARLEAQIRLEQLRFAQEPSQLSGRVVDAAGNPVADAQVALSTEKIGVLVSHGKLEPMRGDVAESRIAQTDSEGAFVLGERPTASFDLIVAHDKGFASIGSDAFVGSNEIRLQSWGRIEGQVARDPGTGGRKISMAGLPNPTWFLHKQECRYETQYDADGRFVFERVPAGWFEAGYLIRIGDGFWSVTCRTPVEVKPGQTAHVTLGGSGRPVVGKFVAPKGYDKAIYFGNGIRGLGTARPEVPRPDNYGAMTKREQQQWLKEWRKTDEYRRYRDAYWHDPDWRDYTFRINDAGSFRIEDVIAGKYELTVWIEEPLTAQGRGEEIGSYRGTIEVPQMPGGRSDEPLDLGELELTMHDPLRVGDVAPLFEAKTLDGKDIKLIDYRGKFVLLSFWQPVSHPERQRLQELYDAYNPDGRLAIIGLGGHDTLEEVRKYVEENHIPWPQIFTGEDFKSGVAKNYRIPGRPWIFLVGPDGKIVASGLRGEKLTSAVRSALEVTNESRAAGPGQPKL